MRASMKPDAYNKKQFDQDKAAMRATTKLPNIIEFNEEVRRFEQTRTAKNLIVNVPIFIKAISGKSLQLNVSLKLSVIQLKVELYNQFNKEILLKDIRLVYNKKELKDGTYTLESYGVLPESTIEMFYMPQRQVKA